MISSKHKNKNNQTLYINSKTLLNTRKEILPTGIYNQIKEDSKISYESSLQLIDEVQKLKSLKIESAIDDHGIYETEPSPLSKFKERKIDVFGYLRAFRSRYRSISTIRRLKRKRFETILKRAQYFYNTSKIILTDARVMQYGNWFLLIFLKLSFKKLKTRYNYSNASKLLARRRWRST